jgi:rod shape determining protein RodA
MERPWYRSFSWLLAASSLAVSILGVVMIHSADLRNTQAHGEWTKQSAYVVLGIMLMAVFATIDYGQWRRWALYLYVANIGLLGFVMLSGHSALGAVRWISLGPLGTFQPSEPAKLILAVSAASLLARSKTVGPKEMGIAIAAVLVPSLLILKQPDFGTTLVVFTILTVQLFFATTRLQDFAVYAGCVLAAAIFTFKTKYILKPFQRDRLLVFLHPNADLQGTGYNLHQSKIAVGSGELFGKGLFQGTQTQLHFVPENSRDFIFTVLGEELGYIGALALIGLYGILIGGAIQATLAARDRFGFLLGVGIVTMFAFHIVVNIGMTVGIMPITGIPLPFMSYGGSAILTNFVAVGILLNMRLQRDQLEF